LKVVVFVIVAGGCGVSE